MKESLNTLTVAVPESRELDLLARMLEARGARTLRCPLVNIRDTPDAASVESWIRRMIDSKPDELILYTGEGVKRLLGFTARAGLTEPFVDALGRTRIIARGPKPGRALRALNRKPDLVVKPATTAGLIECLRNLDLAGHRVGVQLYGSEPNRALEASLAELGAVVDTVAPYVYADDADDPDVLALIQHLAEGAVDVIAFTSKTQVQRLADVAQAAGLRERLDAGLERTVIAAVGPVAADSVRAIGHAPQLIPEDSYFMKPLVREIEAWQAARVARRSNHL